MLVRYLVTATIEIETSYEGLEGDFPNEEGVAENVRQLLSACITRDEALTLLDVNVKEVKK